MALAVDGDPSTAWTTDHYRGKATFGGLKDGVGLLIDLGRPLPIREARLALTSAGTSFDLRAGDSAPTEPSSLALVTSARSAPASYTWHGDHAVTARYWLVWITKLPPDGATFRAGIAEVALLR